MNPGMMFIAILLPLVTGLSIPLIGFGRSSFKDNADQARGIYIEIIVLITSVIVALLLFHTPEGSFVFARFTRSITLSLHIDGMSKVFAGVVAFLWPLASLYALEYMTKDENENIFFMFYTMTYGITLGIAFAEDLFTMYFFYELLTLVTVPLVMHNLSREEILA